MRTLLGLSVVLCEYRVLDFRENALCRFNANVHHVSSRTATDNIFRKEHELQVFIHHAHATPSVFNTPYAQRWTRGPGTPRPATKW